MTASWYPLFRTYQWVLISINAGRCRDSPGCAFRIYKIREPEVCSRENNGLLSELGRKHLLGSGVGKGYTVRDVKNRSGGIAPVLARGPGCHRRSPPSFPSGSLNPRATFSGSTGSNTSSGQILVHRCTDVGETLSKKSIGFVRLDLTATNASLAGIRPQSRGHPAVVSIGIE